MSVKTLHDRPNELYFCTFTCTKWLSLFQITSCYDEVYKCFTIVIEKRFRICTFVIMPNSRKNGTGICILLLQLHAKMRI